tara:strand:- start:328 stop:522 length:195 start_codon:yes stop_codon:yes gene_type:complete
MKSSKRSLSSIMSESYSIYFEFFGIILAWMLCEYLIKGDVSYISIAGGVIHASFKAYQAVMKKY